MDVMARRCCNLSPAGNASHVRPTAICSCCHHQLMCITNCVDTMPQSYGCINKNGFDKYATVVDSGYFRTMFKVLNNIRKIQSNINKNEKQYLVFKMFKDDNDETSHDLLKRLCESTVVYHSEKSERDFMRHNGYLLKSLNEERAFPFVRELGHCIYQTFISLNKYYNATSNDFVNSSYIQSLPIYKLLQMSIDVARGLELLHTLPGGRHHHTYCK